MSQCRYCVQFIMSNLEIEGSRKNNVSTYLNCNPFHGGVKKHEINLSETFSLVHSPSIYIYLHALLLLDFLFIIMCSAIPH